MALACIGGLQAEFQYTIDDGQVTIEKHIGTSSTSVVVPTTLEGLPVTRIGDFAFSARGVSEVVLSEGVTSIGASAFAGCGQLISITLPLSLISIEPHAFAECAKLESITLPENLVSIGSSAFASCRVLGSLLLPASLQSFEVNALSGCESLVRIDVDPSNPLWTSRDGVLFDKSVQTLHRYPQNRPESSYAVPAGVRELGPGSFESSRLLTILQLPDGLVVIGDGAFDWSAVEELFLPATLSELASEALTYGINLRHLEVSQDNPMFIATDGVLFNKTGTRLLIYPKQRPATQYFVPTSVESIAPNSFANSSLQNITLPDSLRVIESSAFSQCVALEQVRFGNGLHTIGAGAFWNCLNLRDCVLPEGLTEIGESAFEACYALPTLSLPDSLTSVGAHAFTRCTAVTLLELGSGLASIGEGAFAHCTGLTHFHIDGAVASIGARAFSDCTNLTSVTLGDSVVSLGESVFQNCFSLDEAMIGRGIRSLPNALFSGCTRLTQIAHQGTLSSIGEKAFYDCKSLTMFNFTLGLTAIGREAFAGCETLRELTLPSSLTQIGPSAFQGCRSVSSINVGDAPVAIQESAFAGCTSVEEISLGAEAISLGDRAFENCALVRHVRIPASVRELPSTTFTGCSALERIEVATENPVFMEVDGALFGREPLRVLTYPSGKSAPTYQIPEGTTAIETHAFNQNPHLVTVIIPESVVRLERYAFNKCSRLATLTIPDGVTILHGFTVHACENLTTITIGAGVTQFWSLVVAGSPNLRNAYFRGDQPAIQSDPSFFRPFGKLPWDRSITIYHLPSTSRWEWNYFSSYNDLLWVPRIADEFGPPSFQEDVFGFTIAYAAGHAVVIEASRGEGNPMLWERLATVEIGPDGTLEYRDPTAGDHAARLYRVRAE